METVVQILWTKSRLLTNVTIIGVVLLLLQIPAFQVRERMVEKAERRKEAFAEISSPCTGHEPITKPVLIVPFLLTGSDSGSHASVGKGITPEKI